MVLEKHHEDMVTTTQQNVFQKFLSKYSFIENGWGDCAVYFL